MKPISEDLKSIGGLFTKNNSFLEHRLFLVCISLITLNFPTTTSAQVSIPIDEFEYIQNFNDLSQSTSDQLWTNNVTLQGWYALRQYAVAEFDPPAFFSVYRGNSGGSSTVRLYSYGTDNPAPNDTENNDRALGTINQDDSGNVVYGVLFQNNSGVEIHSITLSLRVEQWRKPDTNNKGHQRIQVSYSVANPATMTLNHLLDSSNFTEIPEANLFTRDTTSQDDLAIVGNTALASGNVTAIFPVTIPIGSQLFLRFLDDNASSKDAALAIDDLHVLFRSATTSRIDGSSDFSIYPYVDMGMVTDIPDVDGDHAYMVPSPLDVTNWTIILTNFYAGNWNAVDAPAASYGYVLTHYTALTNEYYILRKNNNSPYFWGTFVKAVSPQNQKLVIFAPHPIDDQFTGRQSAAVFHLTGASHLIIAGMGRCVSENFSTCEGQTGTCHPTKQDENFRMSDVAHVTNSIFHLATTILATQVTSTVFVQLHGFSKDASQPHFFISCGTMDAYQKSVPDYAVMIREDLISALSPSYPWTIQITHADNDEELGARDNVQGRFLNEYPINEICEGADDPVTVTNRFLHIEQYENFREVPTYYSVLATALTNRINDSEYVRQIRITDTNTPYHQNFDALPPGHNSGTTHYWGNNLYIPGVYAVRGVVGLFSNYIIDDGSSSAGGLYSHGTGASDRALGSLNTNTTGKIAYGFLFRNDTGGPIYGLDLTYTAEQWRKVNGQTQSVKLSYTTGTAIDLTSNGLLNDILFTNVPAGNLVSVDNTGNGSVDGNQTKTLISNISIPIVLNDGQEIFIRFLDEDVGAAGTADIAMALDDVTVSFSAVPLLVNWRYFEVEKSGHHAILRWAADNEKECERYEIQRSTDGKDFEPIVTLSCQNQAGTNRYEFSDTPPVVSSLVYYRVCQYDFDGSVSCSQVRAFRQKVHTAPAISYQNGSLLIQTSQDERPEFVSVMDFMGRELAEGSPFSEGNNHYRMPCTLPSNQLVIVRITFAHYTYAVRIRTGN